MSIQWEDGPLRSLAADLTKAGPEAAKKAKLVVAKSTANVERGAKSLAPVDTGYLVAGIGSEVDGLTGTVFSSAHYGRYVEQGTSKMAAQPHMVPALAAEEGGFAAAIAQLGGEVL